ncbi:hypothetical protein EAL2_808p05710 (plasmid) [Peptoclostridium acidaminophilum DSM 3953]|uniref:Uncharacterized protein n=1 Tax=Peptoclostridium acidaminophilum DSM 3953 TaxID=1286171 RepID=W8T8Q7_PEPAC|nr:hypothetical protein [Peptoclostridium acidaminophilum]AHM58074.1 hypothetical protein EAL2_808p05710 [Peptoclostridium acidaminophilum DSM 3953]
MNSVFPFISIIIFPIVLIISIIFLILIVKLANKAIRALDIYIEKNGAQPSYVPKEDKGHSIFNLDMLDRTGEEESENGEELELQERAEGRAEKIYSTSLRKFHIVVGGIRDKDVERQSLEVLGKFIPSEAVKMTEDGFIVEVPIQTIPAIIRSFSQKSISLYTVAPIEDGSALQ